MAARKHAFFQGYNFPFCGEENVSQSFIDYGSPSILNIDLDKKDQKVVIHSRQTHDSHILQRLVANQLSLPYMEPNERSSTIPEETPSGFRFIHGDNGKPYRCKRGEFERSNPGGLSRNRLSSEKYNLHVENFSEDHRDVMYSTIAELVQDEFNCYPWNTCNMFKSNSFLPWQRKELGCKLCSGIYKSYSDQESNSSQVIEHLGSALPDISPVLLYDLFKESSALETPRLHYDTFLGNSLAGHCLETNHQGLLVYPSGPGLDVLNFSHISQCSDVVDFENTCTENSVSSLKPVLSNQQFAISGRIRQIDFSSYSPNNMIIGIRSQYHCSFFQSIPGGSTEGQETVHLSLKPLETVALTKQAMCIAVNPYIPGEAVTVTETGGVYLWSCDRSLRAVHQANHDESKDTPWYQCVFAANPRCIAMADTKGMDLLDFRTATSFQRLFFSIPSNQVDSFEYVSAIQRHPCNTHHYMLATDQSLMLLDDRFLHHPVLKWRHHNEDPVQLIDVACNVIPGRDDTVLVISGSKHRQTHCFQYSDSQLQAESSIPLITEQCYLPPQSTSLPWKVSSYNEWYYAGLSSDLTFSPATASRLSQPLIGVCTMPRASNPQKGFTVFQLSSVGDLFYQPFVVRDDKDFKGGTMRSNELSPEDKILCQKWITIVDHQKDDFVKTAPHQFDYKEIDEETKKTLCKDVLYLPLPHSRCVLCNNGMQVETSTELDQTESESSICDRCGVEVSCGSNLAKNRQSNSIVTRSSLGIQHCVRDICIFPDFKKATDPLSKCLWVNWDSAEPIPMLFSGDQQVENNLDNEDKTTIKVEMTRPSQDATTSTNYQNIHVHESSPQKQSMPGPSTSHLQGVQGNSPKVKTERKQTHHVMGF